jgi:hypothetical protein
MLVPFKNNTFASHSGAWLNESKLVDFSHRRHCLNGAKVFIPIHLHFGSPSADR